MSVDKLSYSVVICALARDCGESLRLNIPKIEQLRNFFSRTAVVIVENDSVDGTKDMLKKWQAESADVTVISQDFNTTTMPPADSSDVFPGTSLYRIKKMASYRNIYMDWIDSQDHKFDLVFMIDIDIKFFSVGSVINSIRQAPEDWGALFANGYTDTKLFKKPVYTMFHDMYAYAETLHEIQPYFTTKESFALKKQMNRKLSAIEYLPVLSAFGGIGIYKYDSISGIRYQAVANGDRYMEAVCEHVMFNYEAARRGYGLYISREMKVYYGKSENLIVLRNILPLWMFKLLCLLVRFRKLKE